MPRHAYAFVALPVYFACALVYCAPAWCCDADGIGATAQRTVAAAAAVTPTKPTAGSTHAAKAAIVAKAQPGVTAGAAMSNEDAGNNLGDGISEGTRRHGLRWQSFLPGVIK